MTNAINHFHHELKNWADESELEYGIVEGPCCFHITFGEATVEISKTTSYLWTACIFLGGRQWKSSRLESQFESLLDWIYAFFVDHEYWL